MLEINNLYVKIDNMQIVNNATIKVKNNEIVSLIGANGAGKTSIVRAITSLNPIDSGKVFFEGEDISGLPTEKIVEKGVIMVPEGRQLFARMSVKENLEIGAYSKSAQANAQKNLAFVYELFPELYTMSKKPAGNLSGGQQQMVAIGRGIMANPKLLILDEPSIGLSPLMTEKVLSAVNTIKNNGVSVLIAEQNVHEVLKMASRGYVLQQGSIVLSGTADELMNNPEVKKAYIGM